MDEQTYTVTWTMTYLAESPEDAIRQAVASIDTAINNPGEGADVFIVSSPNGDKAWFHLSQVMESTNGE